MNAAVTLDNVTLSYQRHPAVHHISGTFAAGSMTAITGPNGAGKSSLLKAIAGLIKPDEGRITTSLSKQHPIAYLPQTTQLPSHFPMSVQQLVATGLWHKTNAHKRITSEMLDDVADAIMQAGLSGLEKRNITELSTGQLQRAFFARLLIMDTSLILLDEPFNAIDESTTKHLLDMLNQWHKDGNTIICVLHDIEQIKAYFPQTVLLARECISWGDTKNALDAEKLLQARFFRPSWAAHEAICEQAG